MGARARGAAVRQHPEHEVHRRASGARGVLGLARDEFAHDALELGRAHARVSAELERGVQHARPAAVGEGVGVRARVVRAPASVASWHGASTAARSCRGW